MQTKLFCAGELSKAKVLVIGHDPRLQESNTHANYAFFADYYLRPAPTRRNELAKYRLAEAVYSYISHLTNYQYAADQFVLTNLCNTRLPHAPKGKTVLIPEEEAFAGINAVQDILSESQIEVIFAMSAQVNYWLQKFSFYPAVFEFLDNAKPKPKGIDHKPPYYEPKRSGVFHSFADDAILLMGVGGFSLYFISRIGHYGEQLRKHIARLTKSASMN